MAISASNHPPHVQGPLQPLRQELQRSHQAELQGLRVQLMAGLAHIALAQVLQLSPHRVDASVGVLPVGVGGTFWPGRVT